MMTKITISISPELDSALNHAVLANDAPKSHLVETYLREHPVIRRYIDMIRAEPKTTVYAAPGRSKKDLKRVS
jgi:hypothetical protein